LKSGFGKLVPQMFEKGKKDVKLLLEEVEQSCGKSLPVKSTRPPPFFQNLQNFWSFS
jgi:hypothetical protein